MARSGYVWLEAKIMSDSSSQGSSTSGISCDNISGSESMLSFATDAPFTSASKSTTSVSLSAPVASRFPGNNLVVPLAENSEASVVNDLQLFRALLLPESERLCEARSTCVFARRQLHDLDEAKGRCGFPRLRYTLDAWGRQETGGGVMISHRSWRCIRHADVPLLQTQRRSS